MVDTLFYSLSAFYKEHLWLKISAFVGLVLSACCVIVLSGGLPPWSWRFLAHVLTQLPSLWKTQGTALLPALLGLLLISLSLLIVWVVLVFLLIKVGRGIWFDMSARRHFERDLAEAEFLAQEQADWTREQDEHDRLTLPEYLPELRGRRPSTTRVSPTNVSRQPQERVYATRDTSMDSTRETGASTSRVRRTVPLIPPSRPVQEPAAQQQFRPAGLPQNAHAHTLVSFTPTSAPHRLRMVPHFSAAATVEDDLLPESFHHQRRAASSTLDRQTAYNPPEDEEVSSVWGERQQHYAEQDTRPAHDWWDEEDEAQEELAEQEEDDILIEQDEEAWDDHIATQPLDDEDDIDESDSMDEGDEEEDTGWSQEVAGEDRYSAMQPEEDWDEQDEDIIEIPTQKGATSRTQAPLTRTMLEEEMAAPLSEESADAKIQEQTATMDIPRDIRLVIGIGLDPGLSRKQSPNEDSVFAIEGMRVTDRGPQPAGLFIVADGMGGHANGREASHTAVNSMSDAIIPSLLRETCDRSQAEEESLFLDMLKQGAHQANLALYQKNREAHSSMGTTLTAALIVNLTAYIVNVGDSRTYLYRPTEGLMQITRDHSVVARMVEVGAITKEDVYTHPKRNQIYRCLGEHATVDIDTFSVPVNVGDILLLCSDGLWEMVRDHELERIIDESTNPSQMSTRLVQAALQGGGADNIGAIVVALADASE